MTRTTSRLHREQRLPLPLEEVFSFFADPRNLEAITPPFLRFRVLGMSTPEIEEGTRIDHRLRLRGLPIRWRSLIRVWDPPFRFVDEQERGPYRLWIHEHRFVEDGDETVVTDDVEYAVPGGRLVERLFVRRDVERIFDFRAEALERLLVPRAAACGAAEGGAW